MQTKLTTLEGIELIIPSLIKKSPWDKIKDFPSFCGPGAGIGLSIIPETIYGLTISHCCWCHDSMFELGEAKWSDFHQANSVFFTNILSTINQKSSKIPGLNWLRIYRAATYLAAVNSRTGAKLYWNLKAKQDKHSR